MENKSLNFEITRFFIALSRTLNNDNSVPAVKKVELVRTVEENYLNITDNEVKEWLKDHK
jgi:hypothetical protein